MIDFDTLFRRIGNFLQTGDAIGAALGTETPIDVDGSLQGLGDELPTRYEAVRESVLRALESFQSAGGSAVASLVDAPVRQLVMLTVSDDNPLASTEDLAIRELIRQMEVAGETLAASTVSSSLAYGSANIGTGKAIASVKRADGKVAQFIVAEDLLLQVTSLNSDGTVVFSLFAEPSVAPQMPTWPKGSGADGSITSKRAGSAHNLLANGDFETEDDNDANLPAGWLAPVATLGTTLKLSSIEEQTVEISGTPTGGYYTLSWVNGSGQTQTTATLAFGATASDVQTALQAIAGLEGITVESTGTSPNLTHTITFTGVTNPAQLTSTSALTGGTPAINHATTVAGSANVLRGARSIEFDSDGAQLTTLMFPVTVDPSTSYAANVFLKADVVPAAGILSIDLVNGVGGSIIADDESTANAYDVNAASEITTAWQGFSGVFRTPAVLPSQVFFRIRISTAVSSGSSIFLDEAYFGPIDELYTDGPLLAIFDGATDFELNDRITLTTANNRAGDIHEWMDRIFSLRENRLIFPTTVAGMETINDDWAAGVLLLEDNATLLAEDSTPILLS